MEQDKHVKIVIWNIWNVCCSMG